ncbi:AMP-binding protein [Halobacillus andaensis]|uniref:AMP-binding protein n=1 Tax=Halobacillus andaensis TaxID=1176239 RepID=UPI003D725D46
MACIGDTIRETARQYPDRVAIYTGDRSITYLEFYQSCKLFQRKLASDFSRMKGKKIGFLLPNQPEWLELFIAVSASGGVAVPFDPKWSTTQLRDVLEDAQPDLFIYDRAFSSQLEGIAYENSVLLEEWQACFQDYEQEEVNDDDPFYIGYTSGTTGGPKGFIRNHASWADCFSLGRDVFSLNEKDQILCPGPLVHSHFLYAAVQCLHIGATLHLPSRFNAEEAWKWLRTEEISVMYIVPTMFEALNRVNGNTASPCLKALISSGAKWEEASQYKAGEVFPQAAVYEFYGASELSFVSYRALHEGSHYEGTIGKPFPRVEIQVVTEEGNQAKPGEIGELYVRSPWVFEGYLNRPEDTKKVFNGDWATVGDLAVVNEKGYVFLKGRKQNMIISGGLNIYPEEVEEAIRKHPSIKEVAVIGVEDSYWGEKAAAFITTRKGKIFAVEEIREYLSRLLPKYKCPKEWVELDGFPYTSSGKIARRELRIPVRRN